MVQNYSLEDVFKHASKNDLWIVIHNKVYDITKYIEEHPGGVPVLEEAAGKDATAEFEDVGHSDEAKELLEPFQIGELSSKKHPGNLSFKAYRTKTLPLSLSSLNRVREAFFTSSSGGFWLGYGVATAISSSITFAAVSYINSILNATATFTKYPSTRKFPRRPLPHKPAPAKILDARIYRELPLVRKDKLSHDTYFFIFQLPRPTDSIGLPTGQHVSIRANINGENVMRSYTPTSNNKDLGRLELVIKAYPDGKLTSYMANLPLNAKVEFAGPKGAMRYTRGLCKHIGMVAGGSGITPMYQVIRAICEDPFDRTTVSLLYANKTEADILLRRELDGFAAKCPEKFKVHYVLDHPPQTWRYSKGYVTKELIAEKLPAAGPDSKILLCGPPGMIKATTTNLVSLGFEKPGALSKAKDQVFLF